MTKEKICFLFGAGTEISYNISKSEEFAKSVLRLHDESKVLDEVIRDYYTDRLNFCKDQWYPDFRNEKFPIDKLLKNSIKKQWMFENREIENKKIYEEAVEEEAWRFQSEEEKHKQVSNYPSYMGILDENFHTIVSPKALGPCKFWRVIITYTTAYLLICMDILGIKPDEKEKMSALLSKPEETYRRIESTIDESMLNKNSYYKILGDYGQKLSYNIITTNYTPICEKVLLSIQKKTKQCTFNQVHIAYIHGKLNWFECPYTLQVYDSQDDADQEAFNNYLFFPYLFIQSGIKPVVERKQLNEYRKALKFFDEADERVILGYNLNVDDNHLNSLLHSFVLRDVKKVTYFNYENTGFIEKNLKEKLRICEGESVNVEIININGQNGSEVFEDFVKRKAEG